MRPMRAARARQAEHEQRRRPFGEDDVLQEVRREQVVGQGVERSDGGCKQEETAGTERGHTALDLGPRTAKA